MKSNTFPAVAIAAALLSAPLAAQDVLLEITAPSGESIGTSLTILSDVTGDGIPEFAGLLYQPFVRVVQILDGASGAVLATIPDAWDTFQPPIAAAGDQDGDGAVDLLVVHNDGVGVHSGVDGALLFTLARPARLFGVGSMASVGDLDADGAPEILVGYSQRILIGGCDHFNSYTFGPGFARVYSGRDGRRLFQFDGDQAHPSFGGLVAGLGDVDGDGTPDFLVGTAADRVAPPTLHRVFSGATRQVLYELPPLGSMVVRAVSFGDVNADGAPDFAISEPLLNRVTRFSGADGTLLGVTAGAPLFTPHRFGESLSVVPDETGDGVPDLLVGAPQPTVNHCGIGGSSFVGGGFLMVVSSSSGAYVRTELGTQLGAEFGASARSMGDVNGDGFDDVLVAEPQWRGAGYGRVQILSGNPAVAAPSAYCVGGDGYFDSAQLGSSGSTSLSAADLVLEIDGAWPSSVAIGFYSAKAAFVPFASGYLCTAAPRFRLPGSVRLDGTGSGSYPVRFNQSPVGIGAGAITAGSTWNFQFLYRQRFGPAVNTTGALRATFQG